MIRIAVTAIAALIAGCSTTPIPTHAAREIPTSQVLHHLARQPEPGTGQVVVKRDAGLSASACRSRVFVNGKAVAEVAPGEKVTFYLPEGEHMLGAEAKGICSGGLVESRAIVTRNRAAIFRISYGSDGEFLLQQTAF